VIGGTLATVSPDGTVERVTVDYELLEPIATIDQALDSRGPPIWPGARGNVMFEAFDQNGVSLGAIGPFAVGDGEDTGQTAEDRFFGVENDGGISKIKIWMTNSVDFEIDHVQYGGADLTGVADGGTPRFDAGDAFPNPSAAGVSLAISGADDALEARVYDVTGRLVRSLTPARSR
jgi:hypothetical protein